MGVPDADHGAPLVPGRALGGDESAGIELEGGAAVGGDVGGRPDALDADPGAAPGPEEQSTGLFRVGVAGPAGEGAAQVAGQVDRHRPTVAQGAPRGLTPPRQRPGPVRAP